MPKGRTASVLQNNRGSGIQSYSCDEALGDVPRHEQDVLEINTCGKDLQRVGGFDEVETDAGQFVFIEPYEKSAQRLIPRKRWTVIEKYHYRG